MYYGYTAVVRISGSEYKIPGSIGLQNATGSFLNSELSSGYSNVSDSQKSLTFSAVYSNVFSFNSTFTGSNTTIKTLCIEYKSNDTVSYYGNNYFSYEIE